MKHEVSDKPGTMRPSNPIDRGVRSTLRGESTAFGFSIVITTTFGAVQREQGLPGIGDLLLFAAGAVVTFTLLEMAFTRGFRLAMAEHDSNVYTLGTAMNLASVLLAVLAAIGLAALIDGGVAWLLCPMGAALTYLAAESAEVMLAERAQKARGNRQADEVG